MRDDLDIPDFLRRPMTDAVRARLDKLSKEQHVVSLITRTTLNDDWMRPRSVSLDDWQARQQEKDAARAVRRQQQQLKRNSRDALPKDFNTFDYRWDPRMSRFVRDQFAHLSGIKRQSGLVINDKGLKASKPVKQVDDLAATLARVCGLDVAKLKQFATANGVWQDKYMQLPNPGLIRMNVLNRLRAAIRKGHKLQGT